jgi:HEPN domain-containing protein
MPKNDPLARIVREWKSKADQDFKTISLLLKSGHAAPLEVICFHAQQGAEKYLKAMVVSHGLEVPKTHDLRRLVALLPSGRRPGQTQEELLLLTSYATTFRYPGDQEPVTLIEARSVVRLARSIRQWVRECLAANKSDR